MLCGPVEPHSTGQYLLDFAEIGRDESQLTRWSRNVSTKSGRRFLVVEVIGVLPDVAGQERGLALRQRVNGVRRLGDLQLAAARRPARPSRCRTGRGAAP